MRARGIDPGDTIGWCDIEREAPGVFRYVDSGTWEASTIQRACGLPCELCGIEVLAIETPAEMHPNDVAASVSAARGRHGSPFAASPAAGAGRIVQTVRCLLTTARIAERIACAAAPYVRIVEPTAAECRRALGVKFGAQRGKGPRLTVDQQIAHIIPLAVRGWPKKSNRHVRDAAAAALWALGAADAQAAIEQAKAHGVSTVKAAIREVERRGFNVPPPGTYGPGDYGPDSFGWSDFE